MPLRSFTSAEIVLTERKRLERPLLIMIWLSVAAFSLAEPNYLYLVLCTAAVAVNLYAVQRAKELYIKRVFVHLAVGIATVVLIVELFIPQVEYVVAVGHYITLILLCKLFERKTNRDYSQMVSLSVILFVPSGLICEDMWLAAVVLIYIVLACYTAMIFTVKRGLDNVARSRLPVETSPLAPEKVAWKVIRNWPGKSFRRLTLFIMISIIIGGSIIFLAIPRGILSRGLAFASIRGGSSVSGFSKTVQLGGEGEITLSHRIAMHVKIVGELGADGFPDDAAYLKGQTFNSYSDSRWSNKASGFSGSAPEFDDASDDAVVMDITIFAPSSEALFAPHPAVRAELVNDGLEKDPSKRAEKITYTSDMCIKLRKNPKSGKIKYRVWSLAGKELAKSTSMTGRGQEYWPFTDNTWGIETTDRVREQASEWCRDLLTKKKNASDPLRRDNLDLAISGRILTKLHERCKYSLDVSNSNADRDGVDDFLFHMKRGHCEYFASALAVMCRAVGVRARLAAGYKLDPMQKKDGIYPVRQSNAHAWVEVFTPSGGWAIVEASPATTAQLVQQGWWNDTKNFWEDIRLFWYQNIVGYGESERKKLGKDIGGWFMSIWRVIKSVTAGLENIFKKGWILIACGILTAIALAGTLIAIFRRRTGRIFASSVSIISEGRIWHGYKPRLGLLLDMLELLERKGFELRPCETPRELFHRAADALKVDHQKFDQLVTAEYRWRWGSQKPAKQDLASLKSCIDAITKKLASTVHAGGMSAENKR